MKEVLGAHGEPARFEAFLQNWQMVFARRAIVLVSSFGAIPGVSSLILAGSVGRDEAWPLSDIDLLPIYDNALTEVERLRSEPLDRWIHEGWWTGVDVGNFVFRHAGVMQAVEAADAETMARLQDNR